MIRFIRRLFSLIKLSMWVVVPCVSDRRSASYFGVRRGQDLISFSIREPPARTSSMSKNEIPSNAM